MTNDPAGNDFNKLLSDTVERLKENDEFRSDYAAMNLHDRDIIKRTQKEVIQQKAIEDAIMLIKDYHETPETAAKKVNAPLDKVLEALKVHA